MTRDYTAVLQPTEMEQLRVKHNFQLPQECTINVYIRIKVKNYNDFFLVLMNLGNKNHRPL